MFPLIRFHLLMMVLSHQQLSKQNKTSKENLTVTLQHKTLKTLKGSKRK